LESAGARVVPVAFNLKDADLDQLLSSINGLYIPGDHKDIVEDKSYAKHLDRVLKKVEKYNEENEWTMPVFGVKYGFLNMMYREVRVRDDIVSNLSPEMHHIGLPIKLVVD
jgi:hypothetical protein